MSKDIAKERAELFKSIYGVERGLFTEILELFEQDYNSCKNRGIDKLQDLYKKYSYAIFFMYSPSSIRNNLVKFKNIIKKNGGRLKAVALETFTIDYIYTPLKKRDKEVKQELKRKVRAGENADTDPQIVIDKIKELKGILEKVGYTVARNQSREQVRAYYIVALLGLSTGRRFTELLKTLQITKRGTRITFNGLLKGNDKPIEGNIIHLEYKEVKKYLEELRSYVKTSNLTEAQVNAKYSRVFNNAIKRIGFSNIKALRHNYSVAGSQLFKKENESLEDTVTRLLGHREVFTSALNYT